jgi:protoporphyrinogen oxidase
MNFANQDSQDSDINSETIMDSAMGMLYDIVIDPMEEKLNGNDLKTISLIGITFKIMAEKAHAYEKLMGEVPSEENTQNFLRN